VVKTISLAFTQIVTYALIIFPVIIAYSLIGHGVYGPFIEDYNTFFGSFKNVMKFIVGD
jgi:hypothetical protein